MTKSKFLIAASMAFTLSACGSTLGSNTSMYSVHQPVVERTNYVIDVNVDGGGVSTAEARRTGEWFDALDLRYGDRVAIDYGDGYPSLEARATIASLAKDRGLLLGDVAPTTAGAVLPGTVRVVVSRSTASVPTCPDWTSNSESNFNSSNHSNYGCSTNTNLAAMIADPEDLVRGNKDKALDANSGNSAANAYRAKRTGGN